MQSLSNPSYHRLEIMAAAFLKLRPIVFFFFVLLFFRPSLAAEKRRHQCGRGCYIKQIYNLGDSISDTGNLLLKGAPGLFGSIGKFPYGETTFKRPTGRCSDGLLMIDYLAMALNLPLLNPYLKKHANFHRGVNFAVAGSTALDDSFFKNRSIPILSTNISLSTQFEWFKTHVKTICSSTEDCTKKLERALIMVGEIGGNDFNYAFAVRKPMGEILSYVPQVVQRITDVAKEVIELGASQVVIPGNFPIGCMPVYLASLPSSNPADYDQHKCLRGLNDFAVFYNAKLQEAIQAIRMAYPHVIIMYADYYNAFMHLLNNASNLGFDEKNLLKACCGGHGKYNFDVTKMCGSPGASKCSNPASHISWDGIHLTQAAYKIMAKLLIMGGFTYPGYGVQAKWRCPSSRFRIP